MPGSTADGAGPRALIVTIYGLYARERVDARGPGHAPERGVRRGEPVDTRAPGARDAASVDASGWIPVSLLVRLLAVLDVDEPAVRSAISRLKRRGLLVPERRDGVAGYALSESGDAILAEGDARIFAPTEPRLADGWVLAVFSVPESERAKRHMLRTQLAALGFGACSPGVWIAPAHRLPLTAASMRRHGLAPYVDLFQADYREFGDIVRHARDWWDLDPVRAAYLDFIGAYEPGGIGVPEDRAERADDEAFAVWVRALTAWRRLPYLDPGLPIELLPTDWPAPAARAAFAALRESLAEPARAFVASVAV